LTCIKAAPVQEAVTTDVGVTADDDPTKEPTMRLLSGISLVALLALSAQSQVVVVVSNEAYYESVTRSALAEAVQALEDETGGKVLEIRFARDPDEEPSFEAVLAVDDELVYMRAYSVTGLFEVLETAELPAWMAGRTLTAHMKSIAKAEVPLTAAILQAEEAEDAPAIAAGLASPLGPTTAVLAYNIELIRGDRPVRVAIDAQTGRRIANPEALYETWTPTELVRRAIR
jgi:hypothetical protein